MINFLIVAFALVVESVVATEAVRRTEEVRSLEGNLRYEAILHTVGIRPGQ